MKIELSNETPLFDGIDVAMAELISFRIVRRRIQVVLLIHAAGIEEARLPLVQYRCLLRGGETKPEMLWRNVYLPDTDPLLPTNEATTEQYNQTKLLKERSSYCILRLSTIAQRCCPSIG